MTDSAIRTHDLTRRFGTITAVDRLALDVPVGGVYGFLGPNGAGKSTTIRMLLGLLRSHGGQIELLGQRVRQHLPPLERIGALVEAPALYPHLTGYENLEVICRLTGTPRTRIPPTLKQVGLQAVGQRAVKTYSLGMRQRLGLAGALLRGPELLILDEPTNGLDPAGIHEVRELLRRLPVELGVTVFVSSHLLSEVEQVATHVGIILDGSLIFQGTLDALYSQTHEQITVGVSQSQRAAELLRSAGWQVQVDSSEQLLVTGGGRADAALINAQLVGAGMGVYQLSTVRPTLETIFLQLTDPEHDLSGEPQVKQPSSGADVRHMINEVQA